MRSPLAGWRLPLRIARRDARRGWVRSLLVLVMIALPVLAVSIADTVYSTSSLSGSEGVSRRIGTAEASVMLGRNGPVVQAFDPDRGSSTTGDDGVKRRHLDDVRQVLGEPDAPAVELRTGSVRFVTDKGLGDADVTETDLGDPLTAGLADLTSGRLPERPGEVVVNAALVARGTALGDDLELADGSTLRVVGIAESTSYSGRPVAFGPLGSFDRTDLGGRTYLLGGSPVSWEQVKELNAIGVLVVSRAVLSDPPPASELPEEVRSYVGGVDPAFVTVLALVVAMVLIEVVLLAGPAFAVGARRQARTLALLVAAGGSPRDAWRVVLGAGVVLGAAGGVIGILLGLVGARVLMPAFQHFSDDRFGPFDVSWLHLLGVGAFGLLSALLAAAVPAWIAARQDVVAVLAGRRGDTRTSRRSPVLGVLLLAAGILGAVLGARQQGSGETLIAGSAIVSVLGMVLLVPLVVVGVARLGTRLPLSLRFAVRDAARHRTRTVPAVAAVAATVAGVVALGIATSSDEAENRATYTPEVALGTGYVKQYDDGPSSDGVRAPVWDDYRAVLRRELPGAEVRPVHGVTSELPGGGYQNVDLRVPGREDVLTSWYPGPGGDVLVSEDGSLPDTIPVAGASDGQVARAERVLRSGGVVALTDSRSRAGAGTLVAQRDDQRGRRTSRTRAHVDVAMLDVPPGEANARLVLSPEAARRADLSPATTALVFDGDFSAAAEQNASEAVAAVSPSASFYVEHGYQPPDSTRIVQLVLGALGAVLMLGGTLTATFLALSDARPDLATLAAVGASPRRRRSVAAAYALVVGLVGAALGAVVGLIPGIAITYPLTAQPAGYCVVYGTGGCTASGGGTGPFIDVPWLLVVAVVVGLPLLTAAIVGLGARSRLPLVMRLE